MLVKRHCMARAHSTSQPLARVGFEEVAFLQSFAVVHLSVRQIDVPRTQECDYPTKPFLASPFLFGGDVDVESSTSCRQMARDSTPPQMCSRDQKSRHDEEMSR